MEREKFNTRLGFILVSAGCAIGLGNVWKFPYICGENGGAAFILIYILFLVLLGFPILISEFAVGRGSNKSIAQSFDYIEKEQLDKGNKVGHYHLFKYFGIAGNYLLMMFYVMVGGWMLYYAYLAISGGLEGLDPAGVEATFGKLVDSPDIMIAWTYIVVILAFLVCALGVKKGVEKVTKVMMILLLSLMIILAVHSLTLKNAGDGVRFYLLPDFKKMVDNGIGNVIFAAMSHAFFTLGLGVGSMAVFGSYLKKERTLATEALPIVILDTVVALIAGLIIIPACFAYDVTPDAGPALVFLTLPNVFNNMVGGRIWSIFFFMFMSFAALSTIIAVFENLIAISIELFNQSRKKAVVINLVLFLVLCLPAILGFNVLSHVMPLGAGTNIMDIEDFFVSYNILPMGCLVYVLFCAKKNGWSYELFAEEVNNGKGKKIPSWVRLYMLYVLPVIIIGVYIKGYYDMFKGKDRGSFIGWISFGLVFLIATICMVFINRKKKEA